MLLQSPDDLRFLTGQDAGVDLLDASRHGHTPRGALVVPRHEDGNHPRVLHRGHRGNRVLAQFVPERDGAEKLPLSADHHNRLARRLQLRDPLAQRGYVDTALLKVGGATHEHPPAVDSCRDAATGYRFKVLDCRDAVPAVQRRVERRATERVLRRALDGGGEGQELVGIP